MMNPSPKVNHDNDDTATRQRKDTDHNHDPFAPRNNVDDDTDQAKHDSRVQPVEQQCGLFLAESTLPNAGVGVFVGNAKQPGDIVETSQSCIPLVDFSVNHPMTLNPFTNYEWNGLELGLSFESRLGYVSALSPGTGSVCNSVWPLNNIEKSMSHYHYDDETTVSNNNKAFRTTIAPHSLTSIQSTGGNQKSPLHRSRDPGVGAYSPYLHTPVIATNFIPAGGEVFEYYGDEWHQSRPEYYATIPTSEEYTLVLSLLHQLGNLTISWVNSQQSTTNTSSSASSTTTYNIGGTLQVPETFPVDTNHQRNNDHLNQTSIAHDLYRLIQKIGIKPWENRTWSILPQSLADAQRVIDANKWSVLYQSEAIRSVEWLEQHGRCIDYIQPGWSTIPQAGHGAFASRDIPLGALVATSPLIHIDDKVQMEQYVLKREPVPSSSSSPPQAAAAAATLQSASFNVAMGLTAGKKHSYSRVRGIPRSNQRISHSVHHQQDQQQASMNKYTWVRDTAQREGMQLMLNYCFGHPESSLLFFPYGPGVNFINHNRRKANIRIQWAKDFPIAHNHRMVETGTIRDLHWHVNPMLALEYVATRPIRQGEELFMDYGGEWEKAWDRHVAAFQPDSASISYMPATQWNQQQNDSSYIIRTETEQQSNPYPQYWQIRCHPDLKKYFARTSQNHSTDEGSQNSCNPLSDDTLEWKLEHYGQSCRVLERSIAVDGRYWYKVLLETTELRPNATQEEAGIRVNRSLSQVVGESVLVVPRSALRFFDTPGYTDIHLPFVFRHPIGIPDEIFPQQWRNMKDMDKCCFSWRTVVFFCTAIVFIGCLRRMVSRLKCTWLLNGKHEKTS